MRRGSFDRVMPSPASGSLFASRAPAAQAAADAQDGDGGWFSCTTETVAGWKRGSAEAPESDCALRLRLASALPWTHPRRTSEDAQAMSGDETCSEDGPACRSRRVVGQRSLEAHGGRRRSSDMSEGEADGAEDSSQRWSGVSGSSNEDSAAISCAVGTSHRHLPPLPGLLSAAFSRRGSVPEMDTGEAAAVPQMRRATSVHSVETLFAAPWQTMAAQPPCSPPVTDEFELCCRLSRARQTVDFVQRTRGRTASLDKARMAVPQALLLLRCVPPVVQALLTGEAGPPAAHLRPALHMATAMLRAHPDQPWFAMVGLVHSLGRLLLLPAFGGHPTWSVCGESFPVGCRFDPRVSYAHYFGANPDRRKRALGTPFGCYSPGCGLAEVDMCWSADEYLFEVLCRNRAPLPPAALFCVRYGSFCSLGTGAAAYEALMSETEREALPWLHRLRAFKRDAYAATAGQPEVGVEEGEREIAAFGQLFEQLCPGTLRW